MMDYDISVAWCLVGVIISEAIFENHKERKKNKSYGYVKEVFCTYQKTSKNHLRRFDGFLSGQ